MIGRGAFAIFLGVVALAVAQVAWWITFLVRTGAERRHIVMFASEGSFFMALLLLGVWLMYRTLVEQVRLREMRATFLSSVTHELKSPIAAIRLFLETLERGRADEAKQKDLVRKMLLDTERLERLVNDLLRAGQVEANALAPALDLVDLRAVVDEVVERARPRLAPGDAILVARVEGATAPVVRADRALVASALENLVDNAMKYPAAPRRIEVCASVGAPCADAEAWVRVSDSGPPLDAEGARSLFEPFRRGGDALTRRVGGTGLGLFIVRGIAEAHGGRAFLDDGGRGSGGTRMVIALPLRRAS